MKYNFVKFLLARQENGHWQLFDHLRMRNIKFCFSQKPLTALSDSRQRVDSVPNVLFRNSLRLFTALYFLVKLEKKCERAGQQRKTRGATGRGRGGEQQK